MSTNGVNTAIKLAAKELGASARGSIILYTAPNGNVLKAHITESTCPSDDTNFMMTVWRIKGGKASKQFTVHTKLLATLLHSVAVEIWVFNKRNDLDTLEKGIDYLKELIGDSAKVHNHSNLWVIDTTSKQYTIREDDDGYTISLFNWCGVRLDTGHCATVKRVVEDIYWAWSHGLNNL